MKPGQSAFTRTPSAEYSRAATLVRPTTPCLAAVYAGGVGEAYEAQDRGHVDDGPAATVEHPGNLMLHAQEHTRQVYGEHPIPGLLRIIGGGCQDALYPGVVDGAVETTEGLHATADQRLHLPRLAGDLQPTPDRRGQDAADLPVQT
jgi:hypothetical protein